MRTDPHRTLVCAVNTTDNRQGFINTLAERLPTSQWREPGIGDYASHFATPDRVRVLKYDMDLVEVLAILRPSGHEQLTLPDLAEGFRTVSAMLHAAHSTLRRTLRRFPNDAHRESRRG